jgi:molybdate transport system substrate-binding protein
MDQASEGGLLESEPQTLATNTLTIAVPVGNPGGVESWEDLSSADSST